MPGDKVGRGGVGVIEMSAVNRITSGQTLLVVGDRGTRGRVFFSGVWNKVVKQCYVRADLPPPLANKQDGPTEAGDAWESDLLSIDENAALPPLRPRRFIAPAADRADFAELLDIVLCNNDVYAVLSAAPSSATDLVAAALAPSSIPLILTVDSTTLLYRESKLRRHGIDFRKYRPPLFQLIADNSQQASAIYAALQALRNHGRGRQKVCVWAPDQTHPYVDDLCHQLLDRASTPAADLPLDMNTNPEIDTETLAVVYVGYDKSELEKQLKLHPAVPFLIADGVSKTDSDAWRDRQGRTAITLFFEPTMLSEDCAARAYDACLEAMNTGRAEARTYAERIRDVLSTFQCRFSSEGANVAAGYVAVGYHGGFLP